MKKLRLRKKRVSKFVGFCISALVCLAVCGRAQAQKLSLDYSGVPLKTVLKAIEDQTDYSFVYSGTAINVNRSVTIKADDSDMISVLDRLFREMDITYHLTDSQIVLASPEEGRQRQSSTREIGGIVRGRNGEPLEGANVAVITNDDEKHYVTDASGRFHFQGTFGPETRLRVSYLGYKTEHLNADGRSYIEVALKTEVIALEQVVVTGYQSLPRERATGSFESVSSEILAHPRSNIGESFIGTVSGIQVTGDAKGNLIMEIRGRTTLSANERPLVVVDGFEIEGDISSLNPNDIESITVLKDAAAASIWGARAANGVIVVVTRGGRLARQAQPTKIEISAFMKFSPKIDLDYYRPLASSAETVEYQKLASDSWGVFLPMDGFGSPVFMIGLTPAMTAINEYNLGYITESEMNALLERYSGYDNSKQIKKYLLQNPFTQQYNVNISGATDRMGNNLSLLYESNAFQKKGEERWKAQASYRANIAVTKWLDFSFTGTYSYMKDTDNSIGSALGVEYEYDIQTLARQQLLIENGEMTNIPFAWYQPNIDRYVDPDDFPYTFWANPINELSARDLHTATTTARAQAGLKFKVMQGLDLALSGQYEYTQDLLRRYYSDRSLNVIKWVNETSYFDYGSDTWNRNLPLGGFLDQQRTQVERWDARAQANYNRRFEEHEVTAIAGMEMRARTSQYFESPRAYGYDPATMSSSPLPNGPGSGTDYDRMLIDWNGNPFYLDYTNVFGYRTDRFVSAYANAAYTYNDKYTLSASVRNDASNLISDDPSYRYSPFWSAGVSWHAGREDFISPIEWIDRLTLRLTYGYNGNIDTSTSFMPLISMSSGTNIYTGRMTASISSYGNPTLRWERTGTWNFGIDYSLFGNMLFGKFEVYNKRSKDMIAEISIPAINGTVSQKFNNAEMINRGFEAEIGTRQRIYGNDITWTGSLNVAYNHNKITKLFVSTYYPESLVYGGSLAEGYNVDALWSYRYNGMVNVGSESSPDWQPTIRGAYDPDTGTYGYNTFRGWPTGDTFEISKYEGTMTAPWNIGFVNSFRIYDFDLSLIMYAKLGHKFRRTGFNYPEAFMSDVYPNKYVGEVINGDPDRIIPLPYDKNEDMMYFWDRYYPYMDYLIENAGHIRLREITVTYNVPANRIAKFKLDRLQLYAQANNVWNIYFNKYNEDPEFRLGSVKPTAAFTLGLRATF